MLSQSHLLLICLFQYYDPEFYPSMKDQKNFEKKVFNKTHKADSKTVSVSVCLSPRLPLRSLCSALTHISGVIVPSSISTPERDTSLQCFFTGGCGGVGSC